MSGMKREDITPEKLRQIRSEIKTDYKRFMTWPWWFGMSNDIMQRNYRCPFDFARLVVPQKGKHDHSGWDGLYKGKIYEELVVCPKCGHKLGSWYIKYVLEEIAKDREEPRIRIDLLNKADKEVRKLTGIPNAVVEVFENLEEQ